MRVSGWLLTFGLPDASTVPGTFRVTWKDLHHRSSSEFPQRADAVFGVFQWWRRLRCSSVTVCSSGCVDLTQPAAQTLYNTLHVGEEVQVVS